MDPPYSLNNTHRYEINDPQTGQRLPVTKILDSDGHINYVAISGSKKITINYLYHVLLEFSSRHPLLLPEMLLPQHVPEIGFLIPAKCFIDKPLAEFDKTWFFETVSLYDDTTGLYQQKSLYFTTQFKCVLYSIIRQVILSVKEKVKLEGMSPVIDLKQMFVSPANGVIFTKYQKKNDSEHNFSSEITNLINLIDTIFRNHGDNSRTLKVEMDDLKRFLKFAENSEEVLEDVLEEIAFWDRQMRIDYIYKLLERVFCNDIITQGQTNGEEIFNHSRPAFFTDHNYGEWVDTFSNCKNPILQKVFKSGNSYIDMNSWKNLNIYRTYNMMGKSDCFKFLSGLVRLRDMLIHIGEYEILDEHKRIVTDVHMQAIFQDIFPRHMSDLKKSLKHVPDFDVVFDVKGGVMRSLGLSQDEASTT